MEFVKNLQSFLQSCNKSVINQACSGPYLENIGPRSFLYGPRCARSTLSRPRTDILPVRPSCLVNKIRVLTLLILLRFEVGSEASHRSTFKAPFWNLSWFSKSQISVGS